MHGALYSEAHNLHLVDHEVNAGVKTLTGSDVSSLTIPSSLPTWSEPAADSAHAACHRLATKAGTCTSNTAMLISVNDDPDSLLLLDLSRWQIGIEVKGSVAQV